MESVNEKLLPLKVGQPVAFRVHDPRILPKKRVKEPVILLTPSSVYGFNNDKLIISLPGYGCEVVPINEIKPLRLYQVGLSLSTAKILATELNKLFKEETTNGTT